MTAEKNHIPALDGLRGFAALTVVAGHMASHQFVLPPFANPLGGLGVALFFTLSGFLMSYLYASRKFDFGNVYNYAVSRLSRIAPAYLLVIIASYLIVRYWDADFSYQINNANLLRHLLFSGNVGPLWSIPPEMQFYVFFVFLWWSIAKCSHHVYWPLVGVLIVSLIVLCFVTKAPGTTLPSKLHLFMLGAGSGLIRYHRPRTAISGTFLTLIQFSSIMALLFCDLDLCGKIDRDEYLYLLVGNTTYTSPLFSLVCFAAVLSLSYPSKIADAVFANKPMRLLGAWSFSTYLLHDPLLRLAEGLVKNGYMNEWGAAALGIAVIIAASATLNMLVEKPAQAATKKLALSKSVGLSRASNVQ